jgi:hypothetical protein
VKRAPRRFPAGQHIGSTGRFTGGRDSVLCTESGRDCTVNGSQRRVESGKEGSLPVSMVGNAAARQAVQVAAATTIQKKRMMNGLVECLLPVR